MPSHTAASALITLYYPGGHPWDWPVWQELTGVRHGLFPPDDSNLPKGWTRQDAYDVESYFREYNALGKEEEKIKFATATRGGSSHPGRQKWTAFVSKSWAKWGLHAKIVEELRSHSVHPIQILLSEGSSNLEPWPNADQYVPIAIDSIGFALFGDEAFAGAPLLPLPHRKPLAVIVQRSWSRIREQVRKDKGRLQEIEQAALAAFKGLEEGEPTKTKVSNIISAVARWKNISEVYGTTENQKKAINMISELNRVMGEIGAEVPACQPGSGTRLCKTNLVALKNLATEDDVNDLELIYAEHLNEVESDLPALNTEPILPFNLQEVHGGDLGMEQESHMEPEILASRLGFQHGLPIQFGSHRHPTGAANVWDDPDVFESSPDLQPLKLHWHQLAGVHSIIRNTFTRLPDDIGCSGVLICDEVGLGKTALAVTLIGFLNQYLRSPEQPPPILEHHQYLNGKKIESYPHLIVATGTITHQWVDEMKTLFRGKSVDILPYDSPKTGNAEFWAPDGPFHSSLQRPENKVILTTPTSLVNDLQRICRIKAGRKKWPWTLPEQRGPTDGTIFHQKFLVVIIDEAHEMRNIGTKFHSALRILQQASLKLLLTGTPLLTAPKDISSMARLCGVPHFLSEQSVAEEKEDAIAFRRARKMDDNGLALRKAQIEAVRRMQRRFHGSILRRAAQSLDWKGQVLLDLPPCKEITGILRLTAREMSILDKHAEVAKASVMSANETGKPQTTKFYLEYRATVCFAKDESMSGIPIFKSFDEWEPVKSTKMDACAQICRHYLSRDDVPDVEFEDGSVIFPTVDTTATQFSRERKILIFAEFPSMTGILRNVLTLYGVKSVSISGKMSYAKRRAAITEFHSPCGPRVFIFSSVGSAGLNLSIADIVIFFDQPWSAQDERQIRGRAHRQPQKSTVKVIHLLAESSADVLMNNMARGKEEMFEAFVNKDLGEELRNLLAGNPTYDDDEKFEGENHESDSEALGKRRKVKRKGKKTASKPPKQEEADTSRPPSASLQDVSHKPSGSGLHPPIEKNAAASPNAPATRDFDQGSGAVVVPPSTTPKGDTPEVPLITPPEGNAPQIQGDSPQPVDPSTVLKGDAPDAPSIPASEGDAPQIQDDSPQPVDPSTALKSDAPDAPPIPAPEGDTPQIQDDSPQPVDPSTALKSVAPDAPSIPAPEGDTPQIQDDSPQLVDPSTALKGDAPDAPPIPAPEGDAPQVQGDSPQPTDPSTAPKGDAPDVPPITAPKGDVTQMEDYLRPTEADGILPSMETKKAAVVPQQEVMDTMAHRNHCGRTKDDEGRTNSTVDDHYVGAKNTADPNVTRPTGADDKGKKPMAILPQEITDPRAHQESQWGGDYYGRTEDDGGGVDSSTVDGSDPDVTMLPDPEGSDSPPTAASSDDNDNFMFSSSQQFGHLSQEPDLPRPLEHPEHQKQRYHKYSSPQEHNLSGWDPDSLATPECRKHRRSSSPEDSASEQYSQNPESSTPLPKRRRQHHDTPKSPVHQYRHSPKPLSRPSSTLGFFDKHREKPTAPPRPQAFSPFSRLQPTSRTPPAPSAIAGPSRKEPQVHYQEDQIHRQSTSLDDQELPTTDRLENFPPIKKRSKRQAGGRT